MNDKLNKSVAKKVAGVLDAFLRIDANSTSCCIVYQPKAPKKLSKYRRHK